MLLVTDPHPHPHPHLLHLITSPDDSNSVSPEPICFFNGDDQAQDISFCSLCNFEVKKHSKHCRTCNRCVEGFDHHCRWLNNCVGKKNYTTFILLMISLLLTLMIEGGTSVAVFIRCFADKKHIEQELSNQFHARFPRELLAAISVVLVLVTGYGSAALAQLFLFHLLLIRKGMRTYDYILAMKAQNQFSLDLLEDDDSDFSSDDDDSSTDPPSPKSPIDMCKQQRRPNLNLSPGRLSVRIDPDNSNSNHNKAFHAGIDPWTLIQMSREKAFMATQKAKERLAKEKQTVTVGNNASLNPLPSEMKSGPLMINSDNNLNIAGLSLTPLIATGRGRILGSPGRFSSPRHRRFSGSPATLPNQTYRSNFDLKLTEVSQELETYISRQVLSTVLKDGTEASPR